MENVKMKRKLSYLENKVKEKQNRGCGENDQEQYEQNSTNKEIVKGKKYLQLLHRRMTAMLEKQLTIKLLSLKTPS